MKKVAYCLVAVFTIAASAYFVAQQANSSSVSAHACTSRYCE